MSNKVVEITDEDVLALEDARGKLADLGTMAFQQIYSGECDPDEEAAYREITQDVLRIGQTLTKLLGDGDFQAH